MNGTNTNTSTAIEVANTTAGQAVIESIEGGIDVPGCLVEYDETVGGTGR